MTKYSRILEEVIEREPSEFDYDFNIWIAEQLSAHLEKVTGTALNTLAI